MNRRNFNRSMLASIASGLGLGMVLPRHLIANQLDLSKSSDIVCGAPNINVGKQLAINSLPDELTIAGSRLLKQGFLDWLSQKYKLASERPVVIHGGGCDDGLLAAQSRRAHLGCLCCPIAGSPAEGMYWLPVGQDIKAVLTHASNPVNNISLEQLRGIASGKIRNWKDLGGDNHEIAFVVHDHCPTYFEPVRTLLTNNDAAVWSPRRLSTSTDEEHLRQLVRFRASLGVNSWVLAEEYVRRGELKTLSIDGIKPSVDDARSGAYPLVGPFNLVFSQWVDEVMLPFFAFLYSTSFSERGIVPVIPARALALGKLPKQARDRLSGVLAK